MVLRPLIGEWCNGSTTGSGPVSLGSNPSSPVLTAREAIGLVQPVALPHFKALPMSLLRLLSLCLTFGLLGGLVRAAEEPAEKSTDAKSAANSPEDSTKSEDSKKSDR